MLGGGTEEQHSLASRFLALVAECDLDSARVLREAQRRRVALAQTDEGRLAGEEGLETALSQGAVQRGLINLQKPAAKTQRKKDLGRRIQHHKVKSDLKLKGIEDFAGELLSSAATAAPACTSLLIELCC